MSQCMHLNISVTFDFTISKTGYIYQSNIQREVGQKCREEWMFSRARPTIQTTTSKLPSTLYTVDKDKCHLYDSTGVLWGEQFLCDNHFQSHLIGLSATKHGWCLEPICVPSLKEITEKSALCIKTTISDMNHVKIIQSDASYSRLELS